MKKRAIYSVTVCILMVIVPRLVAAVTITHIMFDPEGSDAGHEWIGILNDGTTTIALPQWRIAIDGKRHKIRASAATDVLLSGASAVIADDATLYASDHPDYHGFIYEGSFTLPNGGGAVSLIDAKGVTMVEKSYQGVPKLKKQKVIAQKKKHTNGRASSRVSAPPEAVPIDTLDSVPTSDPVSDTVEASATSEVAVVAETSPPARLWWAGIVALVLVVSGVFLYSSRLTKDEWQIADIPEVSE